jgi:hypothetical protein
VASYPLTDKKYAIYDQLLARCRGDGARRRISIPGVTNDREPGVERTVSSAWQTVLMDDEELLVQAEEALTEIKVAQGLSERQASVLAALRIRLKGSAGKSLEEMLEATGDLKADRLEEEMAKAERKRKPSLDDLLTKEPKKPDWPS